MRFTSSFEDGFSGSFRREISEQYGYTPSTTMEIALKNVLPFSVYAMWMSGDIDLYCRSYKGDDESKPMREITPDMTLSDAYSIAEFTGYFIIYTL